MTRSGGEDSTTTVADELVFAVCHELGNLLAGVRLEAGLLEPVAEEVAKASRRIENASARAGSLLALVRPLLAPETLTQMAADPLEIMDGLWSGLDAASEDRVQIELKSAANLPRVRLVPEVIHHLMLSAIFCGLEVGGEGSRVRVRASTDADGIAFAVHDEVREPEVEALVLCGRSLVFAVADRLLQHLAGRFETIPDEAGTRVSFAFSAVSD